MIRVSLADEQESLRVDRRRFLREAARVAREAGLEGEFSVALVTDARIRGLNRRYLGHRGATDVLAFPLGAGAGEIVVSAERAVAVARARGVAPRAELMLYVVHGLLHLAGYDDHDPEDARRMHARSLKLLRHLGYRNKITAPFRRRTSPRKRRS